MPYINPNHRGLAYGDGYMQGDGQLGQVVRIVGDDLFAVNTDPTIKSFGILIKDYKNGEMPGIYCMGGVYETDAFEGTVNPGDDLKVSATGILTSGVLDVQEAVVRGRLYEMSSGIPVLEVPETDILAHGTADLLADVATCLRADTHRQARAHLAGHLASIPRTDAVQIHRTADLDVPTARPEGASHGRRASKRHSGRLGPCVRRTSHLTTHQPACPPLTGWRGSVRKAGVSTEEFCFR